MWHEHWLIEVRGKPTCDFMFVVSIFSTCTIWFATLSHCTLCSDTLINPSLTHSHLLITGSFISSGISTFISIQIPFYSLIRNFCVRLYAVWITCRAIRFVSPPSPIVRSTGDFRSRFIACRVQVVILYSSGFLTRSTSSRLVPSDYPAPPPPASDPFIDTLTLFRGESNFISEW